MIIGVVMLLLTIIGTVWVHIRYFKSYNYILYHTILLLLILFLGILTNLELSLQFFTISLLMSLVLLIPLWRSGDCEEILNYFCENISLIPVISLLLVFTSFFIYFTDNRLFFIIPIIFYISYFLVGVTEYFDKFIKGRTHPILVSLITFLLFTTPIVFYNSDFSVDSKPLYLNVTREYPVNTTGIEVLRYDNVSILHVYYSLNRNYYYVSINGSWYRTSFNGFTYLQIKLFDGYCSFTHHIDRIWFTIENDQLILNTHTKYCNSRKIFKIYKNETIDLNSLYHI